MQKQKIKKNIIKDDVFGWNILGKIIKIVVRSKNVPENVNLKIQTEDNEILVSDRIKNNTWVIHPINEIKEKNERVEEEILLLEEGIVEVEETIIEERVKFKDYYYAMGGVAFIVTGLQESESIDSIKIIYESNEEEG